MVPLARLTRTSRLTSKRYSFWWDNTAPDFCYQSQLPGYADAVIIGAGIAGLSTAYWLARSVKKAKKTFRIVILEQAPHPGFKASGRHGGAIYLGSNRSPIAVVNTLGEDKTAALYRYSMENNRILFRLLGAGLQCDLEDNGGLRMATTAKEMVELEDGQEFLQTKLGITATRFDQKQTQHLVTAPSVHGSMFVPFEGMMDPFAFCNNLSRLLRTGAGVSIVYGASVVDSGVNGDGVFVTLSNGHKIHTTAVIHTTTKTPQCKELSKHIVYKREHVVRTTPFGEDLDDMVLPLMPIELGSANDSLRLHGRSLLMTGGKGGLKKDIEIGVQDDSDYNKKIFDYLNAEMMLNLPFTNLLELTHVWTYIETSTRDSLPVMGPMKQLPGHYINAAHGRNKLGLAFLGGKNIAESILGSKVGNVEFDIFSPSRF